MTGPKLLATFIETSGNSKLQACVALKVSVSTLHYWLHGSIPREASRRRIESWTKGAVPASAWRPERAQ